MMTQTHSLIAVTLLARPACSVRQHIAILLGSLAPDIAIYGLFFWSKIQGIPEQQLWQQVYYEEPMLTFTAIGNSLPLYLLILCGVFLIHLVQNKTKHQTTQLNIENKIDYWAYLSGSVVALFSIAAITHLLGDFPVHVEDAHPHFWPISDWRFESPISYWDRNHHGQLFSFFETLLGIVLSIIVFKRFKQFVIRILTSLALISYIAVPVYFSLVL